MAAPEKTSRIGTNPYVGPRSFQVGEHLYGRSREGTELTDLLIAERIVLLYSPSGAGKSSLINAVLIPSMQKEGFKVGPVLRINAEPPADCASLPGFDRYVYSVIRSLEDSLPEAEQHPAQKLASLTLVDYMKEYRARAKADDAVFLILDQFEEILRLNATDQDAKLAFFNQLGELLRTDRSLWVLFAIREDYLAAIEPYGRPLPNRLSVTYRLDFLTPRAAVEAIQGPAMENGVTFEDDAAAKLVENLSRIRVQNADGTTVDQQGPYVEPVQLQVVCRRIWERAAAKGVIKLADVSDSGNIDDALSDYYTGNVGKAVEASGQTERQIREWFDRKLITPTGIRGQVLMEPESSSGLKNTTIKLLQEAYLVRADTRGNAVWFELAHDRLTRPIRRANSEWFAQHLSVFQRQADYWMLQGKPAAHILTGQAYLDAEEWVKEHPEVLTQPGPEKEFLEACRTVNRAMLRDRRMNTIIRWSSLGLLALAVVSIIFFFQAQDSARKATLNAAQARQAEATAVLSRQEAEAARKTAELNRRSAEDSRNEAEVRKLVAQSVGNLSVDPEVSVKLALEALKKVDPEKIDNQDLLRDVEDALRRALPAARVEQILTDPSMVVTGPVNRTFRTVSFDRTGARVAVGGEDGILRIWSTAIPGKLEKTLPVFEPEPGLPGITSVAFSPDGDRLAAATGEGHVLIYNATSLALEQDLTVQQGAVLALDFNQDGTRLAVAGAGGLARIWNLDDPANALTLVTGEADVQAIAISPDGARLATGTADGVVVVWDAGTGRPLYPSQQAHKDAISAVVFSPNGRQLATAGADDRLINLWNLGGNFTKLLTISGHPDSVNSILFTRDGASLISVSSDRTVRFWDTTFGRAGMVLSGHTDQVYGLAISPDGKHIATSGKDLSVRLWNIAPEGSREYFTFANGSAIQTIGLSADGSLMAAAGEDGLVRITRAGTDSLVRNLKGHTAAVESVAFSPDGRSVITAGRDGTARLWNAGSGAVIHTLEGHRGTVWAAAFSTGGKLVATAGQDGFVKIWDADSGQLVYDLLPGFGPALTVAFNQDDSLLAAGYAGSAVVLWDVKTGDRLEALAGHTDAVRVVAFRPDGKVLVSAGDDGSIRLWNMSSDPIGEAQASLRENGDAVFSLAFTVDGKHLFSGGAAGLGTLWDMDLRAADFFTYGHTDRITGVAISPNMKFLYTGSRDGTLRMHVFAFNQLVELANKRRTREFTAEECYQLLNTACPSEVNAAEPPPDAADVTLKHPADNLPAVEGGMPDADSSAANGPSRARYNDNYELNLYERPFSSDMSIFYPDVDIIDARIGRDREWMYFTLTLAGEGTNGLGGNYAVELDMNGDGRGDHLITALAPAAEWSTGGVRIWKDQNRDVGGSSVYISDPSQTWDGYETLLFDQGSGDAPDLAWARISPRSPTSVEIAIQRAVVETGGRSDESFVWLGWASRESLQPAWFDFNDHFTEAEIGAPIPGKEGSLNTVLKNLPGLDNTCRFTYGFTGSGDVFCKQ